jgi:hypothetical protein
MDVLTAHDVAERGNIPSACDNAQLVDPGEGNEDEEEREPMDISNIPDAFIADRDDAIKQSAILNAITGTTLVDQENADDEFDSKVVKDLPLSWLKRLYERGDRGVADLLSERHKIHIDDQFRLPVGLGEIRMNTDVTMLDYHLTVGNCLGFGPLLPNAAGAHRFCCEMDLQKPYKEFKGKNAMVGFDTKGRMLYIGRVMNEDVFLAMAPNEFISGHLEPCRPGHNTGPSVMSRRHYRQVLMMIVHFLEGIPERSFMNIRPVYDQDLESPHANFQGITNAL